MGLKNLWAEFKAFAFKGNMIELAVAVVIGAAFSTVINSLVSDVIMPTVGYVVNTATTVAAKAKDVASDTVGLSTSKPAAAESAPAGSPPPPPAAAPAGGPQAPIKLDLRLGPVNIGAFIGALLNFLLVAAAVFLMIVKLLGSVMKKVSGTPAPSQPTTKECTFCLSVIPLKAIKCPQCTADLPAIA